MEEKIEIPKNVEFQLVGNLVKVKGPKGENSRKFAHPSVTILKKDNLVVLSSKKSSKKEKAIIKTFRAHMNNLFRGVTEGFVYKLKICYVHFPISVSVEGNQIIIKNFFGEKVPRKTCLVEGAKVKVEGTDIIVEGTDIEKVGQTAANIETATKVRNRDRRVFQDGCYIYQKGEETI